MAADRQNFRKAHLGKAAQVRIGRRLRLVYRPLIGEPIPDECVDLLLALRRKERELGRSA
ncbi:NepR family anti-sigma factor [Microvirga lotononidis]|uniref:NepR family anti-sigma factor n=1 Tax=Microvirga lotononidis TaxID=864069 RepID=UPI000A4998FF